MVSVAVFLRARLRGPILGGRPDSIWDLFPKTRRDQEGGLRVTDQRRTPGTNEPSPIAHGYRVCWWRLQLVQTLEQFGQGAVAAAARLHPTPVRRRPQTAHSRLTYRVTCRHMLPPPVV